MAVSLLVLTATLVLFFARGLRYGTDFNGGVEVTLTFPKAVTITELGESLSTAGLNCEIQPVLTRENRFFNLYAYPP